MSMSTPLEDHYLPDFDYSQHHQIEVAAPPARVFSKLLDLNLSRSPVIRWLFWLRGLPSRSVDFTRLEALGFARFAEKEPEAVLWGVVGQFWRPGGELQRLNGEAFLGFDRAGFAKATWSFQLAALDDSNQTRLETETRILCLDRASRRKFGAYWFFVRPFSGWIRREVLMLVKQAAEDGRS